MDIYDERIWLKVIGGAGPDLGDDAGGHGGPDDVVAAVVLAGDAVERLDVDGVGHTHGRFQFRAAGNALGYGSHLWVIGGVTRIVVKTTAALSRFAREGARPWIGTQWYGMDTIPLASIP